MQRSLNDLELSMILKNLPCKELFKQVLTPVARDWHTQGLIEIYQRTTDEALFFQGRYLDYIFKNHTPALRKKFIDILQRSGRRNSLLDTHIDLAACYLGALFETNSVAFETLRARLFCSAFSNYIENSYLPAYRNALISLYCLAHDDSVRTAIFASLTDQLNEGRRTLSTDALYFLVSLVPYLTKKHFKRFISILGESLSKLIPLFRTDERALELLNLAKYQMAFSNRHIPHDIRKAAVLQQTLDLDSLMNMGINDVSLTLANMLKVAYQETSSKLNALAAELADNKELCLAEDIDISPASMLKTKARYWCFANCTPLWFVYLDKNEKLNYPLSQVLSNNEKIDILNRFIKGRSAFDYTDIDLFMSLIPYYASLNLKEELTNAHYDALIQFYQGLGYPIFEDSLFRCAASLILVIHRQIPFIPDNVICKYLEFYLRRLSITRLDEHYNERFTNDFITLFLRLPFSVDIISSSQITLMNYLITHQSLLVENHGYDPYAPFTLNLLSKLPEEVKNYVYTQMKAQLTLALKGNGISTRENFLSLFLIARVVNQRSQLDLDDFFALITNSLACTIDHLHEKAKDNLVRILHILYEINDDISFILGYPVHALVENFLNQALHSREMFNLFEFICGYKPILTKQQITNILSKILHLQEGPILRAQGDLSRVQRGDLLAALGNQLKSIHSTELDAIATSIQGTSNPFLQKLFAPPRQSEQPKPRYFPALELRNAIAATNGFTNRVKHGYFKEQPARPFREMLELVSSMEREQIDKAVGFEELLQKANMRHAHSLIAVIVECQNHYFNEDLDFSCKNIH